MFGFIPSLRLQRFCLPSLRSRLFITADILYMKGIFCVATFGLILFGWRASQTRSAGQAALAGVCAALMLACKETALLHFVALAAAAIVFRFTITSETGEVRHGQLKTIFIATVSFLLLSGVLFTWFGRNWKSLPALLHAAPNLIARATGQGHEKPFWYFGRLLAVGWSGGLLVGLACLGLFIIVRRRDISPYRWLAYYGLLIAIIYSLIPYKTPWLALNLWLPLTLFAACGVESLWQLSTSKFPQRATMPAFSILAALTAVVIAHDTRQRVFLNPADENNPYAYSQTSEDILGLPVEIADLARQNGITSPRITVIAADPWPLPWYLRHFSEVGFWQPGQQSGDADFYITSAEAADQYADRLKGFRPEFFGVRPGVLVLLWSPAPK